MWTGTGVDWDVATENNNDVYTDTVTEFIRKCIGDVILTVTIKTLRKYSPPWHFSYFVSLQPGFTMDFLGGLYHLIYSTCLPL